MLSRLLRPSTAVMLFFASSSLCFADTYVGSFQVDSGPNWVTVPTGYNGLQAAALIFGGSPTDYRVSVNSSLDPLTITDTAWYSTWGGACLGTFPCGTIHASNLVVSNEYLAGGDMSAYVQDWAVGSDYTNYVWRVPSAVGVPEPGELALLSASALGLASLRRRYRNVN